MTKTAPAGSICQQYNGKTKIRLVKIISTDGATVHVEALNGPLAGSRYDIPATDLIAPEDRT